MHNLRALREIYDGLDREKEEDYTLLPFDHASAPMASGSSNVKRGCRGSVVLSRNYILLFSPRE